MKDRYYKNYQVTQYDDYNHQGLFLFNSQVEARYIEQEEPPFKNNLLIEALPPILNVRQLFKKVSQFPLYSEIERSYSEEYRLRAIGRLENYVLPLSPYYD